MIYFLLFWILCSLYVSFIIWGDWENFQEDLKPDPIWFILACFVLLGPATILTLFLAYREWAFINLPKQAWKKLFQ